jgi:hypothetical protein
VIDLGRGQAIDPLVVSGVTCPYRSSAFPIPQPGGQIGFIEYLAACRRDCGVFDATIRAMGADGVLREGGCGARNMPPRLS